MIVDRWLSSPVSYAMMVADIREDAAEWENGDE